VDRVGHVECPVAFAGATIGAPAKAIASAKSSPSCDERLKRARLPLQGAVRDGGEELESDVLGDVLGGVVIHERPGRAARDDEDSGEETLIGGDVENDGGLHDETRLHLVG